MKYRYKRPTREHLAGLSCSEFKTLLKRLGFKVHRDFFKVGSIAKYKNRIYRFRWWSEEGFVVDKSCHLQDFDRWANSVEEVITFDTFHLSKCSTLAVQQLK